MDLKIINTPSAIKRIIERYEKGYSPFIVFTGDMRSGKTSKAYLVGQWLSWLIWHKYWDWKESVVINIDQFLRKMDSAKNEIIYIDECQYLLNAKQWYSQDNIIFNKIITSQAYKHMIFILVLPYGLGLAKDHRRIVDYVFYVKDRKEIYPHKRFKNFWNLDEMESKKFFMMRIPLDYKKAIIKKAFKEELKEVEIFKTYIEENMKQGIMDDLMVQRGLKPMAIPKNEPIKVKGLENLV